MPIQRLKVHIDLPPLAAGRPRLYAGSIHMRQEDKDWRWMAGVTCKRQWGQRPPLKKLLLLRWNFYSHSSPGDLDNLLKNALDMMAPNGLIVDDNCTRIPSLNTRWTRTAKDEPEWCEMTMIWRSEENPEGCSPGVAGPFDQKVWPKPPRKPRTRKPRQPHRGQGTLQV